MKTLLEIINYLVVLIDIGAGSRIIYCLIMINSEPDDIKTYTKKIKNLIIFVILANTALSFKIMLERYYT